MSKASEWSERVKAARGAQPDALRLQWPKFRGSNEQNDLLAQAVEDGNACISAAGRAIEIPGHLAAALGRWLLDTFGEEK